MRRRHRTFIDHIAEWSVDRCIDPDEAMETVRVTRRALKAAGQPATDDAVLAVLYGIALCSSKVAA